MHRPENTAKREDKTYPPLASPFWTGDFVANKGVGKTANFLNSMGGDKTPQGSTQTIPHHRYGPLGNSNRRAPQVNIMSTPEREAKMEADLHAKYQGLTHDACAST